MFATKIDRRFSRGCRPSWSPRGPAYMGFVPEQLHHLGHGVGVRVWPLPDHGRAGDGRVGRESVAEKARNQPVPTVDALATAESRRW